MRVLASFISGSHSSASTAIFVPMHVMGMVGMPRRYSQFTEYAFLNRLHPLVLFVSIAAIITVTVQLVFYFNLFWSMFKGAKAADNPWEARHSSGPLHPAAA